MSTAPKIRRPKIRSPLLDANVHLDPVACAAARIQTCKDYGMAIDPRDEAIVNGTSE